MSETTETRLKLLDATERLMIEEGYAAVTARRIATEAGVTAPLVHYHFGPLDDLFIAVLRRRSGEGLARQAELMAGPRPLSALWDFSFATATVRYISEFMSLAHHREAVREELVQVIRQFHNAATASLEQAEREGRIHLHGEDPAGVVTALINTARGIAMQRVLGKTEGHEEAVDIVMRLVARLEGVGRRPAPATAPAPARRARRSPR